MAELPKIPIASLTPADNAISGDLFEISEPLGTGYVSKRLSINQIASYVSDVQSFDGLSTIDKTLIGAINEILQKFSGHEFSGTLLAGHTTIQFEDSSIITDSTVFPYTTVYGVVPEDVNVIDGRITLTFEAQDTDLGVRVVMYT